MRGARKDGVKESLERRKRLGKGCGDALPCTGYGAHNQNQAAENIFVKLAHYAFINNSSCITGHCFAFVEEQNPRGC